MDEGPQPQLVASLTVLEKANRFRTQAELIRAQQSDTDELTRITHRVAAVRTALQNLDRALKAARSIADLPDAPTIDTTADDGYNDFKRKIDGSDFNDAVFRAAVRKLDTASAKIDTDGQQAWKTWTAQRLGRLRPERIAVLPAAERKGILERRTRLERIATTPATPAAVTEFVTSYDLLREQLDDLPDLPSRLVDLLERLSQRKPLTIADLSEDDLLILRESEVGSQIELRRRDS
jgi:hypothetical protein